VLNSAFICDLYISCTGYIYAYIVAVHISNPNTCIISAET